MTTLRLFIIFILTFLVSSLQAASGELDTSFNSTGKTTANFPRTLPGAYAHAIAIQSDGKIVLVGGSNGNIAVARFNSDGTLNTSFGSGGMVTQGGFGGNATGVAVQIQPADGKIVVAGVAYNGSNNDFVVLRYRPNGSLDSDFGGGDGIVNNNFGGNEWAKDMILQPDGKIVVGGYTDIAGAGEDFALARYDPSGFVDISPVLGTVAAIGGNQRIEVLLLLPDGKILAGGSSDSGGGAVGIFARFDGSTLTIDSSSFGSDGTDKYSQIGPILDMARRSDGHILFSGGGFLGSYIEEDNALDEGFGSGGIVNLGFSLIGNALALQGDGKILVAGTNGPDNFYLARYNSNGSLDTTFGQGGVATADFGDEDHAYAMAIQSDGRILVAGLAKVSSGNARSDARLGKPTDFALARFQWEAQPVAVSSSPPTGGSTTVSGGSVVPPESQQAPGGTTAPTPSSGGGSEGGGGGTSGQEGTIAAPSSGGGCSLILR